MTKESNGLHNGKPIYCPVNGWDCPYYEDGICYVEDPIDDCADFGDFWESWEEYDAVDEEDDYEPEDSDCELGFNPYIGSYDYDC